MAFELNEGQGTMFRNDRKEEGSKQPDYRGDLKLGGELLEVAGWIKEGKKGKFLSITVKPKQEQPTRAARPTHDDGRAPF